MKASQTVKDALAAVVILGILLAIACGGWVVSSYFEARAYNRVTGEDVSTWDAMWVELRVQSGPKGGK